MQELIRTQWMFCNLQQTCEMCVVYLLGFVFLFKTNRFFAYLWVLNLKVRLNLFKQCIFCGFLQLLYYTLKKRMVTHLFCILWSHVTAFVVVWFSFLKGQFTYIGVKQINAVQALAPVNAALDAAEWRFALNGAHWGGCCDGASGRAGVYPEVSKGAAGGRRTKKNNDTTSGQVSTNPAWLYRSRTKWKKRKRRRSRRNTVVRSQKAQHARWIKWH